MLNLAFRILSSMTFLFRWLVLCLSVTIRPLWPTYPPVLGATASDASTKPNITIGFLSSFTGSRTGKLIAGAIPLAVEDVNRNPELLPNHTLQFVVGESGDPNTADAIREMTNMREKGAVAFIGPDDSCAAEALVAAAWDFPMISYKCSDRKVSDKKIYTTFARTFPPSSKESKSVISLLKHFKWTKIILVVSKKPSDIQMEEALNGVAAEHGVIITETHYIPGDYLTKNNETIKEIIKQTYKKTRVYVLLADTNPLVDFTRYMQEQGLLENGEYIIICVDDEVYDPTKERQYIQKESEITNNDVLPFRAVLVVTHRAPINPEYEDFKQNVTTLSMRPPFIIPTHPYLVLPVPLYAGLAYDAVLIYAKALTEALANNSTEDRGTDIINYIRGHVYQSIHGFSVRIDENGDAEGNFAVLSLLDNPNSSCEETKTMQPVGRFTYQEAQGLPLLLLEKQIDWIAGAPPAGEPKCGFNGELCEQDWKMILIGLVTAALVVIAGIFSIRHYRYEQKMARMLWKVDIKDLILLRTSSDLTLQNSRNQISMQVYDVSRLGNLVDSGRENSLSQRLDSRVGFYKGNVVFIKYINKRSVDLTRSLCKELINIREMRHENINPVIGACVDPPNVCVLTLFCARGSLEDVLKNEDLDLDNMFIASLVADLIKGMIYLHETDVVSHGKLKSSNCLVDSRWVLQIADYGLHELKQGQEIPFGKDLKYQRGLLWRSPELLRMMNPPPRGTQKGDVYSFAIILYEIIGRKGPWGPEAPPGKFIIERVMNPHHYGVHIYRPPIDELTGCNDYILRCMQECWDEDPDARPDFRLINQKLRDMQTGLKNNIFDNMIAIMEKYAYNLEGLVQERTNQLMEEKKKTENLLLRMLPKPVAEQLKRGEPVEAEIFDCVTIYFSDIVGFTELSAVSTPLQVVDLLNDLYTCFDSIIGHYDVYKVETIGDAYMVVSGLPLRNGDNHAGEIASMALHLLGAIQNFEIRHRPGERLKLRIGVHSGPCVAGVVGLKMPRYCLFGDTVNTSSRMESTGKALKIHVSEACKDILDKLGGYVLQERGLIPVKGKGEMRTYWLVRKESDNIVFSCDSRSEETINDTTELHIPPTNNDIIKDGNGNTNQCLSVPVVAQQKGITPHPDFSWLISHEVSEQETSNSGRRKRVSQISNYSSCGSLFQDCKKNILREFRSNSRPNTKGYRSAPIISFRDRASCRDYLL